LALAERFEVFKKKFVNPLNGGHVLSRKNLAIAKLITPITLNERELKPKHPR
jgi:hypothetical protein